MLALSACDEPPTREIDAARSALDRARRAGADLYAPERFREAAAALDAARDKIGAKDYRAALSAATDAGEKSKAALQAAEAARILARASAETTLREVAALFDEIKATGDEAVAGRAPARVLAELSPAVEAAHRTADAIAETIRRGDFPEAQRAAADLKIGVATLADQFRRAVDGWKRFRHPRAPKGGRPTG